MLHPNTVVRAVLTVGFCLLAACNVNSPDDFDKCGGEDTHRCPTQEPGEFNRGAAAAALHGSATEAKKCKTDDGPVGTTKVKITWASSGKVTKVVVQDPPFAGTSVGACIATTFASCEVPPFEGSPVSVTKSVTIN